MPKPRQFVVDMNDWPFCHCSRKGKCIVWPLTNEKGYGRHHAKRNGKVRWVHWTTYLMFNEWPPYGYVIDHVFARGCRHRNCCNPNHLEAVTQEENMRRTRRDVKKKALAKAKRERARKKKLRRTL